MKTERLKEEIAKLDKQQQSIMQQLEMLRDHLQQVVGARGILQSLLTEAESEVQALAVEEPKAKEAKEAKEVERSGGGPGAVEGQSEPSQAPSEAAEQLEANGTTPGKQ